MFNETLVRECPVNPKLPWGCSFESSALEDRTDLELTIGQSHAAMVLQYQIQGHTYYGDGVGYGWNDATSVTDIGDCFSITPYYLGPGDYDPDAVMEDKYLPKTLSGPHLVLMFFWMLRLLIMEILKSLLTVLTWLMIMPSLD